MRALMGTSRGDMGPFYRGEVREAIRSSIGSLKIRFHHLNETFICAMQILQWIQREINKTPTTSTIDGGQTKENII